MLKSQRQSLVPNVPFMKIYRVRPICSAPNCFSPSLLLLQHFVLSHDALRQQRFSSAHAPTTVDNIGFPKPPEALAPVIPSRFRYVAFSEYHENHDRTAALEFVINAVTSKEELRSLEKQLIETREVTATSRKSRRNRFEPSPQFVERAMQISKAAANIGEEYTGLVINPIQAAKPTSEFNYPWASKTPYTKLEPMDRYGVAHGTFGASLDRLDQEIHAFWAYIKPDGAEMFARKALIDQVCAHVRQYLPHHGLEVFGSERTGMSFALSDIDFRLIHPDNVKEHLSGTLDTSEEQRDMLGMAKDLRKLQSKAFSRTSEHGWRYKTPGVRFGRYPLLTVKDRATGLDVQIVLSKDSARAREYMKRCMAEYPYVQQLHAVVKAMLDQRGLTNVYYGGFGSYAIFVMIMASLQHHANERNDAAGALLNFLHYWAYFDTRAHGVSVSPAQYFDKNEHRVLADRARAQIADGTRQPLPDWMLCLRDPVDETNDLGRTGTSILHVQATLRELATEMTSGLNYKYKRLSLLAPLLGDIFARQRGRRAKLRACGLRLRPEVGQTFSAVRKVAPRGGAGTRNGSNRRSRQEGEQEQGRAATDGANA